MVLCCLSGDVYLTEARGLPSRQMDIYPVPALGLWLLALRVCRACIWKGSVAWQEIALAAETGHRKPGGLNPQNCVLLGIRRPPGLKSGSIESVPSGSPEGDPFHDSLLASGAAVTWGVPGPEAASLKSLPRVPLILRCQSESVFSTCKDTRQVGLGVLCSPV